jgi:tetratricopeptide (TPR) repeat protein
MTLSAGDRLGRYEILGPIGAGGMGEVWRARDTELDREVAVKVLPESFASDENRLERFQREARALAALSHPNLLEIYDVGSTNGIHYAVTELLEGDTLRERITPTGLPWPKVTAIGAAVADGLAAAHGRGIIHRDIKPENLFITADGRVKILDFGLAAVHGETSPDARTATITEAGTVMGTPGYMAPEQVKGQPADARSDIFSLGCVIYEMASGHRAFGGDTGAEVIAAILKDEPPQLSSSGAAVPVDLERAVHRCLEKRPEARFQSAADLAYSLKSVGLSGAAPVMATPGSGVGAPVEKKFSLAQIGTAAVLVILAAIVVWRVLIPGGDQPPAEPAIDLDPNRIAVVPFTNRTGDASLDNLAGLTADRLTQGLADLNEIEVAPASVVAVTSAGVDSSQLAREVAAGTRSGMVLTGVWDAVGADLELQATLEDAALNTVVRAFEPIRASRDAPHDAIATLRDWTLMAVQDHLHPILAWGAGDRFPTYAAYLSFRRFFEEFRSANLPAAARNFFQAAQLDPEFARPRIHAGSMWTPGVMDSFQDTGLSFYQPVHEMELTARQQRLVDRIDARIAGNWSLAFRQSRDELELDPTDSWQRFQLMRDAEADHRPNLVIDLSQQISLDPITPSVFRHRLTAMTLEALHLTGRHDEELALAREYFASGPDETLGDSVRAAELHALAALGRMEEIDAILAEVLLEQDNVADDSSYMRWVAYELRAHGFRDEAQALAERIVAWFESGAGSAPESRCDHCKAYSLKAAGRYGDARSIFEKLLAEEPESRGWIEQVGVCAAHLGDRATALAMDARLAELVDDVGPTGVPYDSRGSKEIGRAGIAAQLGDRGRAIHLIQQAVSAGFNVYMWIHVNPDFEPLWGDPEFQEIMRPKG